MGTTSTTDEVADMADWARHRGRATGGNLPRDATFVSGGEFDDLARHAEDAAGFVVLGRDGRVTDASDEACRLLAVPGTGLVGTPLTRHVTPADRDGLDAGLGDVDRGDVEAVTLAVRPDRPGPALRVVAIRAHVPGGRRGPDRHVVAMLSPAGPPERDPGPLNPLAVRVVEHVAGGATTTEIAARLYLSKQGVEYHVACLLRRLGATNRAELVARAYHLGVLGGGRWPPRAATPCSRVPARDRGTALAASGQPG